MPGRNAPDRVAPYGAWPSPIGPADLVQANVGIGQVAVDGDDLLWAETRPGEGGRTVIVRRDSSGRVEDLLAPPWNARTRVNEYGGGSFAAAGGRIFFSHDADQRLYGAGRGEEPRALTPAGAWRYADATVDAERSRLIAVREDASCGGEPVHAIVAIPLASGHPGEVLVSGHDFYSNPRTSPDGRRLAWLAWRHPHMPWDATELWVADVRADGSLRDATCVAGGTAESIFQPEWSPGGVLHFVSDRSGWWNLYRLADGEVQPLRPLDAEFGVPQWVFGASTYAFATASRVVTAYCRRGTWHLATLDETSGAWQELASGDVAVAAVRAGRGRAWAVTASPSRSAALVEIDLATGARTIVRRCSPSDPDEDLLAVAEPIEFATTGGESAHAFFYAPRNRDFRAPDGERPPLRVRTHGGPTAATDGSLKLAVQFWTSRGFAVLDVNYRGSTGYGRAYRERLKGAWGVVDVDDCVSGALAVAEQGRADRDRLTIVGSSAGGYTALCALTFRDVFRAGASLYGIGDLAALARDTHKFESRYLDSLVAPWQEGEAIYRARSPLFHAERLSSPVIFFQGLDDPVVPPNQAEAMVAALRRKGLPVAYLAFAGESHGFRRAETIRRVAEAELAFFARILGFAPADDLPALAIENLPAPPGAVSAPGSSPSRA